MAWWKPNEQTPPHPHNKKAHRLLLQALEPRMMFDGVALTASTSSDASPGDSTHDTSSVNVTTQRAATTSTTDATASAKTSTSTTSSASTSASTSTTDTSLSSIATTQSSNATQVVFIESDVANYQTLIAQLPSSYEVVILDSNKDGLALIAEWASSHSGYAAMHIISHGEQNDLMLGTLELTSSNISNYQSELTTIGQSLAQGGDILLYGCNIAEGSSGATLVNLLAQDTQHTVAGSIDTTGASTLGGNWTLEYNTGTLQVTTLDLSNYDGLLSQPVTGVTDFSTSDLLTVGTVSGTQVTATIQGWDFTMQMASNANSNNYFFVENDSGTETVDTHSDSFTAINYVTVKANNNATFSLNSLVINAMEYSGYVQITGYLNGSAVANQQVSVTDINFGGGEVAINLLNDSAFQTIDSFRITPLTQNYGSIGIGNIDASNFHMPGPSLTTSGNTATYLAGSGAAVAIDSGIQLSDSATSNQTSATVAIVNNLYNSEDLLSFINNDASLYGNISASYNSSTGVLTLSSSGNIATDAQWQAALRSVTYQDTSLTPVNATRIMSFSITNGTSTSAMVTKSVLVQPDAAPVISALNGDTTTYYAGNSAVHLDTGTAAVVTDSDTTTFSGGSLIVHVAANGHSSEDILSIDSSGAVSLSNGVAAGSHVSVNNVIIGTIDASGIGSGGQDLIIDFNSNATSSRVSTLMNSLTYDNSATTPNTSTRIIQVVVNDGRGQYSATSSLTVALSNAALLSVSSGSAAFIAGDNVTSTPINIDNGITIVDHASSTLATASVSISGNFHSAEDVLLFTNSDPSSYGNIAGSYNSSTGILTLTSSGATATIAQWQAALRNVFYSDSAITPTNATRTISFQVTDGSSNSSSIVTRTVTVTPVDQTPLISTSSGSTTFTTADNGTSTPIVIDNALSLSDRDNTSLASAVVQISGNFQSGDILQFSNTDTTLYGNISASYNSATGVMTFTSSAATASLSQWQNALRSITYTSNLVTPDTQQRIVLFTINDGTLNSQLATRHINIVDTDQTPIVTTSGGSSSFTAADNSGSTPIVIDSGITVSDRDNSTLASATVTLSGNLHSGEDILAFTNNNISLYGNIAGSYDSNSGVLTLSSSGNSATLAQWQAALRATTYSNSAVTPNNASRTVSFSINDGSKTSAIASKTVTISDTDQTPIVNVTASSTDYMLGTANNPIVIDNGITLSDQDNSTLASATVAIIGNYSNTDDILSFSNTNAARYGNIVASYDNVHGILNMTSAGASASLAQWQAALQAVTYANSQSVPDVATRTISYQVNDGQKSSALATQTITMQLPTPTISGLTTLTDSGAISNDGITQNSTPGLYGSTQPNYDIAIYVDNTLISTTHADGTGNWSYTLSSPLADGTHSITAQATVAGVNSSLSTPYQITIDTQAPSSPSGVNLSSDSDSGLSDSDGITQNNQPRIIGSAEANSLVTVYLDGNAVGTTHADNLGAWQYTLSTPLSDGIHSVNATATDNAGNLSNLSSGYRLTIDTQAPTPPSAIALNSTSDSGTSHSDAITHSTLPVFNGQAEANSLVTVYLDGNAVGTTHADNLGAWQYTLSTPLSDGIHSVNATAMDNAGNTSSLSADYHMTIDTQAPQLQSITARDPLTTSSSSVSYQLVFNKAIAPLTTEALTLVLTGNLQGTLGAVIGVNDTTYIVQINNITGTGTLSLALQSAKIHDIAGNALNPQQSVPVYQFQNNSSNTSDNRIDNNTPTSGTSAQPSVAPVLLANSDFSEANHRTLIAPIFTRDVLNQSESVLVPPQLTDNNQTLLSSTTTVRQLLNNSDGEWSQPPLGAAPFGLFTSPTTNQPRFISHLTSSPHIPLQVSTDIGAMVIAEGQSFSLTLPEGTILTRQSPADLSISARQSNGEPLPAWIKFDARSGRFTGQPPVGWSKALSIEIHVVDKQGHGGSSHLELKLAPKNHQATTANKSMPMGKLALDKQIEQQRSGSNLWRTLNSRRTT